VGASKARPFNHRSRVLAKDGRFLRAESRPFMALPAAQLPNGFPNGFPGDRRLKARGLFSHVGERFASAKPAFALESQKGGDRQSMVDFCGCSGGFRQCVKQNTQRTQADMGVIIQKEWEVGHAARQETHSPRPRRGPHRQALCPGLKAMKKNHSLSSWLGLVRGHALARPPISRGGCDGRAQRG